MKKLYMLTFTVLLSNIMPMQGISQNLARIISGGVISGIAISGSPCKERTGGAAAIGVLWYLILNRYTPTARLYYAKGLVDPLRSIPLATKQITKKNEDTVLEDSDCYEGIVSFPLINAAIKLHQYNGILKKAASELNKAIADEPSESLLAEAIQKELSIVGWMHKVVKQNMRYIKKLPRWNKQLKLHQNQKRTDATVAVADAELSKAQTQKWFVIGTWIKLARSFFGGSN